MTDTPIAFPGYQIVQQIYTGPRTSVYQGLREFNRIPVVLKIFNSECPTVSALVQFRHQYNAYFSKPWSETNLLETIKSGLSQL